MKQYEINSMLGCGATPKEIARALGCSIGYVYEVRRRLRAWENRVRALLSGPES